MTGAGDQCARRAGQVLVCLALAAILCGCSLGAASPTPTTQRAASTPTSVSSPPPDAPSSAAGATADPGATALAARTVALGATATVVRETTPFPVATVPAGPTGAAGLLPDGFRRFSSRIHPYSMGYPRDWRAEGDAFRFGDVRGDRFSVRDRRGVVTVNVLSEPLRGRTVSTEQYVALNVEQIRETGGSPERAGSIPVDGVEAQLITWRDRSRPLQEYEITQAIWTAGDRGWVVTLATPPGGRAANLPLFRAMLATMDVRAS